MTDGDAIGSDGKDKFLEEIDLELKLVNARLKQVLSEAETLLKAHFNETEDPQDSCGDKVQPMPGKP